MCHNYAGTPTVQKKLSVLKGAKKCMHFVPTGIFFHASHVKRKSECFAEDFYASLDH